jgi:hypothetical protein
MRSPDTGWRETVYLESEVNEIKEAMLSVGLPPTDPQEDFITREELMDSLGLYLEAVRAYEAKGLLHRQERPRQRGRPQIWYPRSEHDHLRTLLDQRRQGAREGPRGPCLTVTAAVQKYGWTYQTLEGYEKDCPCLPGGRLAPEWYTDELGGVNPRRASRSGRTRKAYHICDLDIIQQARNGDAPGYYDTGAGRLLTLQLAARYAEIKVGTLRQYVRRCNLLPEGKRQRVPAGR